MKARIEKTKEEILALWEKEYVNKSQAARMLGRGYRSIKKVVEDGGLQEEVVEGKVMIPVNSLKQYAKWSYNYHKKIVNKMILPKYLTKK